MFSEAISSISWRCRPSSPLMAAAISGSASARVAVKKESGAEAVLALVDGGFIGEYPQPPQPVRRAAGGQLVGGRKRSGPNSILHCPGQALAVLSRHLCKIWWGLGNFIARRASRCSALAGPLFGPPSIVKPPNIRPP